jgi:hypothetical protein
METFLSERGGAVRKMGHMGELYRPVGEEGGYKKANDKTIQCIPQSFSDKAERESLSTP